MNCEKWLRKNTADLSNKWVAVTGTTGGLGQALCRYLCEVCANIILLDRNPEKSAKLQKELQIMYPNCKIERITVDLEDMDSVRLAVKELKNHPIDIFIHNAGAYSIPRHTCPTGFDNVFQINFVSPYYMISELLPTLKNRNGHVVAVGSIAHNYSKTDPRDIDFSTRKASSRVYGNAKRFLMFSLFELFKKETEVTLSVAHPGITFTNITAHYPKVIFAVIKHPMKIIFMKPKNAALCILNGVFEPTDYHWWIGPKWFDVWGMPRKKALRTCNRQESQQIGFWAKQIYEKLK